MLGVELGDAATGEVVGVTLIEGVLLAEEFELGDTDGLAILQQESAYGGPPYGGSKLHSQQRFGSGGSGRLHPHGGNGGSACVGTQQEVSYGDGLTLGLLVALALVVEDAEMLAVAEGLSATLGVTLTDGLTGGSEAEGLAVALTLVLGDGVLLGVEEAETEIEALGEEVALAGVLGVTLIEAVGVTEAEAEMLVEGVADAPGLGEELGIASAG